MRFMVMVRSSEQIELGQPASRELAEEMMRYNEELAKAGVLLAADGLLPSSKGAARVRFDGNRTTVLDGPFTEAKELIAGFWLIEVRSLEEAVEWVRRCPNTDGAHGDIEIRQVAEPGDLGAEAGPVIEAYRGRAWALTDQPPESQPPES
jgi:hypothetical protein